MYDYITGKIAELTPAYVVLEACGVGYLAHISLQTYSQISGRHDALLFVHLQIKEDARTLYGFAERGERELFRMLISVSGVGAATACIMLSALSGGELAAAIASEDTAVIKSIKGIGQKTAERIVVDLKDKVLKMAGSAADIASQSVGSAAKEAAAALVSLGFPKAAAEKVCSMLRSENPTDPIETIIKKALQRM
jgi:Holliday junction DNA helicase RuvA